MRSLFASFVLRRHKAAPRSLASTDPADLGTAFGLDASLINDGVFFSQSELAKTGHNEPAAGESPLAWLSQRSRR